MIRYFYNKVTKERPCYTRQDLIDNCLANENIIEITETQSKALGEGTLKYENGKFIEVIKPQPSRAEIEAKQKADYEREVQSLLASRGYTQDKVQAIVCNSMIENDTKKDEHTKELAELQKARRECKDLAYAKVYKEK